MGITPDKLEKAKQAIWKDSQEPANEVVIQGMDFTKPFSIDAFMKASATTGFQATQLAKATKTMHTMLEARKSGCRVFLGFTSNMMSSGVRESILHLVKNKHVDVLATTAGGIEEDIIKCLKPFLLGDFRAKGAALREKGINRTGNIFVPNDRYCAFEDFLTPILKEYLARQQATGQLLSATELIWKLGEKINDERSVYYWAFKHQIPVFCHAITDGSIGDIIYFFRVNHPEFKLETLQDASKLNDLAIEPKETGIIVLGAGLVKHMLCNANMFREGAKYAVYVNTAVEYDGSDSGAEPEEAISWGKIAADAEHVKVFGDATILFPLMVAAQKH